MAYEALEDLEIFQLAEQICDRFYELTNSPSTNSKLAESSVAYKIDPFVGEFIDEEDWLDDVNDQLPNHQSPNQLF